jgi:hypothetical protein
MWCALSAVLKCLSFMIAAGPAITVILGSESRGTRDHILPSEFSDSPQPEGPRSRIYISQEEGGPVEAGTNISTVALRVVGGDEKVTQSLGL